MNIWNKPDKIFITCSLHIAPYLRKELEELGFPVIDEKINGIETGGTLEDCIKLNFNLRTATRVLYHLQTTTASTLDYVYNDIKKINWEDYLDPKGFFSVDSFGEHPSLNNTMFLNLRVKDGIVDWFNEKLECRPDTGPDRSKALVYVYWKHNQLSVYLDTSGENLTRHGYRKIPLRAPLQENLAAAMVLATRWDQQSHFINPMCGSGTLAIEAALIGCERVNGLLRDNYGFMHLEKYESTFYDQQRAQAKKKILMKIPFKIIATDLDLEAVQAARRNAQTAGVDHLIEFSGCDFKETPVPEGPGIVMINPPYGERIGEEEELLPLYKGIGEFFKKSCSGKTGYVFSSNQNLVHQIGLKPKRKILFLNAKIECKLMEYELYSGTKKIKKEETAQSTEEKKDAE